MKRSTILISLLALLAVLAFERDSRAVIYLDWAGEFIGGRATVFVTGTPATFYVHHQWDHDDVGEPPTWGYVGHQGSDAAGKANAQEKTMTYWYEASPYAYGGTINLATRKTARSLILPIGISVCG